MPKVQLPPEVWSMTEEEYLQWILKGIADHKITKWDFPDYFSNRFRVKYGDILDHAVTVAFFELGIKVIEEECKRRNIPFEASITP